MDTLNQLVSRLVSELLFLFAWLGLIGWLGYEWGVVVAQAIVPRVRSAR